MEKILDIKNLSISFPDGEKTNTVLHGINLYINTNEVVGVVGESGSGKSLTSLCIMGLLPPVAQVDSGSIFFGEEEKQDLLRLHEKEIIKTRGKEIAMIFQEPMTSLNPVYTCGNQVIEAILQHQDINKTAAKQKVIELFKEVQLPRPEEIYKSYPHQLSGGQRQRVMIAMAISCEPKLLIADEPTTALDVTVQKTILQLLKSLQKKRGMSILFITHDLGVVNDIADRVTVMFKGKIVEEGLTEEIFHRPKQLYTKGLQACRPTLNQAKEPLPTIADFMGEKPVDKKSFKFSLPTQDTEPILLVKGLSTHYASRRNFFGKVTQEVKAVNEVSFEVFEGETIGLVGESGCGKSTLGRTILKLTPAHSGEVFFKGQEIISMSEKQFRPYRKEIQLIFQDPYSSLNPRMTIGKAILEPMTAHHLYQNKVERKEKSIHLLEKVGLSGDHFNRYPHEFSGGQRQRICIARTLALKPDFIICDESVSALDVSVQAQVLNLLNDLKQEFGLTYIFISHDLSVVKYMSDRILVMKNGIILESGTPDEIYHSPKEEYTRALINSIPGVGLT